MNDLRGKWALVTGASSGLGVDFARELAERGASLILVARRLERLEEVAGELREAYGVDVDVIPMDLGAPGAPQELYDRVARAGRSIDVLVNNAGYGVYGYFLDIDWDRERSMLELDIVNLVHLTKLFARDMVSRGYGRIMQVSSIGAYQATPTYASYTAAKSFVLHFGEALQYELRGTGVTCTVVSPGVTKTEFLEVSGQTPTLYQRLVMMDSPTVARIGIRAMLRGRSSIVPGFLNAISAWFVRLTPRRLATTLAYLMMRNDSTAPKALPQAST